MTGSKLRPLIRKNEQGEMYAGFLHVDTGEFEIAMNVTDGRDMDQFLDTYGIACVVISSM